MNANISYLDISPPPSMNLTMTLKEEQDIQTITKFFVPVIFGIILTIGLIGNILVITVVSICSAFAPCFRLQRHFAIWVAIIWILG